MVTCSRASTTQGWMRRARWPGRRWWGSAGPLSTSPASAWRRRSSAATHFRCRSASQGLRRLYARRRPPLDEPSAPRPTDDLAVLEDDLAARDRHRGPARHREALVRRVIHVLVQELAGHGDLAIRVEDDQAGVRADRER